MKLTIMNNLNFFEENGLKIDGDRILTYSQLNCLFDCKYCFVNNMNFNQKRNVPYLTDKQIKLLNNVPEKIKLIMLGCDTEFFQNKSESIEILYRLSKYRKDISTITKMILSEEILQNILNIDSILNVTGNIITLSVSITSLESAKMWEPNIPSPQKRIDLLKRAYNLGIKTLVALRPLLPTVNTSEIEEIIRRTKNFCYGYYSGPLYLKELSIIQNLNILNLTIENLQPHWMPE
jgi:DNA repair photolyase